MDVNYFYCPHCGYEDFDIYVGFSATYADDDYYFCPKCKEESPIVGVFDDQG